MYAAFHYCSDYAGLYALNQYFASQGIAVLSINYRSGVGYGTDFKNCDVGGDCGWMGAAEYKDVRAGRLWLDSHPSINSSRVVSCLFQSIHITAVVRASTGCLMVGSTACKLSRGTQHCSRLGHATPQYSIGYQPSEPQAKLPCSREPHSPQEDSETFQWGHHQTWHLQCGSKLSMITSGWLGNPAQLDI